MPKDPPFANCTRCIRLTNEFIHCHECGGDYCHPCWDKLELDRGPCAVCDSRDRVCALKHPCLTCGYPLGRWIKPLWYFPTWGFSEWQALVEDPLHTYDEYLSVLRAKERTWQSAGHRTVVVTMTVAEMREALVGLENTSSARGDILAAWAERFLRYDKGLTRQR